MEDYHIIEEIGKGRNATVYKSRQRRTIIYRAIKAYHKVQRQKILNEIAVLYRLPFRHKNIVQFYNWYETSKHLWVVVEYCTGGDLLTILRQDKCMPESSCREFALHVLRGLQYIHSHGFIHGDVRLSNLLINEHGVVKISHFGLARPIPIEDNSNCDDDSKHRSTIKNFPFDMSSNKRGAPYYMSPELFYTQGIHSFASDIWSVGCVLLELATGRPPFCSKSIDELVSLVLTAKHPTVDNFSKDFCDFIDRCLAKNPEARITWHELVRHPWIDGEIGEVEMPRQPLFEKLYQTQPQATVTDASCISNTLLQKPPIEHSKPAEAAQLRKTDEASFELSADVLRMSINAQKNFFSEVAARQCDEYVCDADDLPSITRHNIITLNESSNSIATCTNTIDIPEKSAEGPESKSAFQIDEDIELNFGDEDRSMKIMSQSESQELLHSVKSALEVASAITEELDQMESNGTPSIVSTLSNPPTTHRNVSVDRLRARGRELKKKWSVVQPKVNSGKQPAKSSSSSAVASPSSATPRPQSVYAVPSRAPSARSVRAVTSGGTHKKRSTKVLKK